MWVFFLYNIDMNNLENAIRLMDSLVGNEPIEYIKQTLNMAYAISDRLLDAKVLLSRLSTDLRERESILVEAIRFEKSQMPNDTFNDDYASKQYLRALVELDSLYIEMNCLPLRIKVLEEIYHFKADSLYNSASKLYCLYLYFDRINDTANVLKDVIPVYKNLADLLYALERNHYAIADEKLKCLEAIAPKVLELFEADDDDQNYQTEVKITRELAYYINRNNRVIDYIIAGRKK